LTLTTTARDEQGQALASDVHSTFTVQLPPTLAIESLSPPSAPAGATVTINGQGFSAIPASNTVSFSGVNAIVTSASVTSLVTTVPATATSGPLTVSVGAANTSTSFVVLPPNPAPLRISVEAGARPGIEAIAITPDGRRAYITQPSANSVLAFDIPQRRLIKTIPVGLQPQGIAIVPDGNYAYVANTRSDNVTVIDIDPSSPDYHHALPHSVPVGDQPVKVQVSGFGPTVFVLNSGAGTLSLIDAAPAAGTFNQVTRSISVGSGGSNIVITPDGTRAYIATSEGIQVVDVASQAVTGTIKIGTGTKDVAITPDGTVLFALANNGTLNIVDIAPGSQTFNQVTKSINPGSGGQNVTVSPDGTLLYLTIGDLNVTQIFHIVRGAGGGSGSGVAPGEPTNLAAIDTVEVGEGPSGIAMMPDGSGALIANEGSGTVSLLVSTPLDIPAQPVRVTELRFAVQPTPSFGRAALRFSLPARSEVEIDVFDLQGRLVKRLADRAFDAGLHTVLWSGEDRDGEPVRGGIYFARMRATGRTLHARVVWLK
jgi:YVTN family beta-propeller protein